MAATRLDGKACAEAHEEELKIRITACKVQPHLAVVIVGNDPASHVYVANKVRACQRLGIKSTHVELPSETTEDELRSIISNFNSDNSLHGILIQSPLPSHMDEDLLTDLIDPAKDVDGFHPVNLGRLVQGRLDGMLPCTPSGVMKMLEWAGVELQGKKAVIIGRSRIVGMPQALLLSAKGAVIDVGINRVDDDSRERGWRLVGDVDPAVADIASLLSPVPGGVGPMTIAMLMANTVLAAESQHS